MNKITLITTLLITFNLFLIQNSSAVETESKNENVQSVATSLNDEVFYTITNKELFTSINFGASFLKQDNAYLFKNANLKKIIKTTIALIISSDKGLFISLDDGTIFRRLTSNDSLPSSNITSIHAMNDLILIGTTAGLASISLTKNTKLSEIKADVYTTPLVTQLITDIASSDNNVLISTNDSIIKTIDFKQFTSLELPQTIISSKIKSVKLIPSLEGNRIIVGTYRGTYLSDKDNNFHLLGDQNLVINKIIQHKNRFFIGTEQGLYKFESSKNNSFEKVTIDDTHNASNIINDIFVTDNNQLLLSTYNGIYIENQDKFSHLELQNSEYVNTLEYFPSSKELLIGTSFGFFNSFNNTQTIIKNSILHSFNINSFALYKDTNTLYIGTTKGLVIKDQASSNKYITREKGHGILDNKILDLTICAQKLYISTKKGISTLDLRPEEKNSEKEDEYDENNEEQNERLIFTNIQFDNNPAVYKTVCSPDDSQIYAATSKGIYISSNRGDSFEHFELIPNKDIPVFDILITFDKKYYATKSGLIIDNGDNNAEKGRFKILKSLSSIMDKNKILKVTSKNDTLYLATLKGLAIVSNNGSNLKLITTEEGLPSNHITDIVITPDDKIIVSTVKGIAISNADNSTYTFSSMLLSKYNHSGVLNYDSNEDIYYQTPSALFWRTNNNHFQRHALKDKSRTLLAAKKYRNNIFYATNNGLAIKNIGPNRTSYRGLAQGIPNNFINDIVIGPHGKIYLATTNGIAISTNSTGYKFKSIKNRPNNTEIKDDGPQEPNLPSNYITKIFLDEKNILYIGTDKGLSISKNINVLHNKTAQFKTIEQLNGMNIIDIIGGNYENNSYMIIVTNQKIFKLNKMTEEITPIFNLKDNKNIASVHLTPENILYVSSTDGYLYYSTDLGHTQNPICSRDENYLEQSNLDNEDDEQEDRQEKENICKKGHVIFDIITKDDDIFFSTASGLYKSKTYDLSKFTRISL